MSQSLDTTAKAFVDSMLALSRKIAELEAKAVKYDIPHYADLPMEELEKRIAFAEQQNIRAGQFR